MTQRKSSFSEEFAIIPKFLYVFCVAGFAVMLCVFLYVMPHHDPHSPPLPLRVLLSVLTGVVAVDLLSPGRLCQPGCEATRHGPGAMDPAGHLHSQCDWVSGVLPAAQAAGAVLPKVRGAGGERLPLLLQVRV